MKNIRDAFTEKYNEEWQFLTREFNLLAYDPHNVSNLCFVYVNIGKKLHLRYCFFLNFTLFQEHAVVAAKAKALYSRLESDAKFLEELENQSMVTGLPESTLTAMLRELNEMLQQIQVNQNISFKMIKER